MENNTSADKWLRAACQRLCHSAERKEEGRGEGGREGKEGRKKQTTSSRASATEAPIGLFTVS